MLAPRRGRPLRSFALLAGLSALAVGCSGGGSTETIPRPSSDSSVPAGADVTSTASTGPPPASAEPTGTTAASTASTTSTTTSVALVGGVVPGTDWALGELPPSVDRAALDSAVDAAFGAPDAASRVRSIVVVQGGEITYERYHPLDSADTVMDSFSVSKSVTSAVIGLLVGDGLLDVDEPAPVAAWSDPADPRHEITVEHLLHMASGLEWAEEYGEGSRVQQMFAADRASDVPAEAPLVAEPGEEFVYSTGTTAILAGIAIDTLGGVEEFDAYVQERLLDPLGITSMEFIDDRSGRWFGGFGANATTRDFARFGLLYLNDGVWDGRRILPEGWVDYSHEPSPANEQYGAQWWMFREGAFEARGLFGQIVLVSQPNDLVIAINTTQGGDADALLGAAYDLLGG